MPQQAQFKVGSVCNSIQNIYNTDAYSFIASRSPCGNNYVTVLTQVFTLIAYDAASSNT